MLVSCDTNCAILFDLAFTHFKLMKIYLLLDDDAEKFTSEMHDPCARSRCLQERTTQKHLQGAPVWSRPNTLRRLSQKCFYNSRVLERS